MQEPLRLGCSTSKRTWCPRPSGTTFHFTPRSSSLRAHSFSSRCRFCGVSRSRFGGGAGANASGSTASRTTKAIRRMAWSPGSLRRRAVGLQPRQVLHVLLLELVRRLADQLGEGDQRVGAPPQRRDVVVELLRAEQLLPER